MATDLTPFGGGAAETSVGHGVLILMVIVLLLTFLIPRKFILAPVMFGLFLFPTGQTFVLGGVHLYVTRILILAGLVRSIVSRPSNTFVLACGYTTIDKVFTLWTIFRALSVVLVFQEMGAVVNQLGFLWDAFGGYFLMRMLIANDDDVWRAIKLVCGVAVILGATMLYEKFVDVNVYGIIAGHQIISEIRNASIRAQGPFHHAILAGTFGATLLPLFFWLWKSKKSRVLGFLGMAASTAITFSAASSTPVSAYLAAILGVSLWPLRRNMRVVRWGIVIGILLLNFAMHAPVWWALAHIDLAGGSAGHHRAELVDNFIGHFSDWWLIGTKNNASWGFLMSDISNQYVAEGECGGLLSFVCIIAVIALNFRRLGMSRRLVQGHRSEWYFWLLGAAFFSHAIAFLGISYFDQTIYAWYALLAMITAATATATKARTRRTLLHSTSRHADDMRTTEVVFSSPLRDLLTKETL